MPIASSDLELYKSSQANSDGGTISVTAVVDNVLNNLFPDVSASDATSGGNTYRKGFIKNNHGSLTLSSPTYWRSSDTTNANDELWVGLGTTDDDDGSSELTSFTAGAKVALVSDGADTRNVTIVGEVSGVRTSETVALNGATEVLSTNTFDSGKVYIVYPASTDAARTITIKQGSGGTTRGTIAPNKKSCICFLNLSSSTTGLKLPDLAAAGAQGLWIKRIVDAGAASQPSNSGQIEVQGQTA